MPRAERDQQRRPFKEEVGEATVRALGERVAAHAAGFDVDGFVAEATDGLDALELKARVGQVASALDHHLVEVAGLALPEAFAAVAAAAEDLDADLWTAWPATAFVEQRSLDDPDAAVAALARLTRHASAEFALRPLLDAEPEATLSRLRPWVASDDVHLRRAASEATRPRLPWGGRLPRFVADPTPVIGAVLDRLRADPEEYVRRSVANNLNDVAKDHPDLAVATAERWMDEAGASTVPEHEAERTRTAWTVRHALRHLVKQGHPGALRALGYDPGAPVEVTDLEVLTPTVVLGGEPLRFRFTLRNRSDQPVPVVVDHRIHHLRADGSTSPKVFKLTTRSLGPGEQRTIEKAHPMRTVTTRTHRSGRHHLDVQVNGSVRASRPFDLEVP